MKNLKQNKKINFIWKENRDTIKNINHTNINNNINITNYYPTSTQDYCKKETFTFINENGSFQNLINYPIKTTTHKTKKINDSSYTPNHGKKKFHQCQSPYIKKVLHSSSRHKSEDGNKIINIYKNSPSSKHLEIIRKNHIKNQIYNENISMKNENKKTNRIDKCQKYYLDISSDKINNKINSNRNNKNNYHFNNSDFNKIKNSHYKSQNNSILNKNINKSMNSCISNGKENLLNIIDKPTKISTINKIPIYKIITYDKTNLITYNYNLKNQKNYFNNKTKKAANIKLKEYIILIQSTIRGFLLRIKLAQYLNLYDRIKKAIFIIQYLIFERKRYALYIFLKNKLNKNLYNYSYLTPTNNISLELKNLNIKNKLIISNESFNIKNNKLFQDFINDQNTFTLKNNESNIIQKELNKKKIDYIIAEKKIKELLLENKKIQNINNIIVRDNKQLALKLKHFENNRYKLEIQNTNFSVIDIYNKNNIKLKINNILRKIITKKIIVNKLILSKYFFKFIFRCKFLKMEDQIYKNNTNYIIENNNFIINKNINNIEDVKINIEKRNKKLKLILNKKKLNLYILRNVFEKWMFRALILKNKEFVKEKKKKKKEKFRQRKQKRMYGSCLDKNDKKINEDENDNSIDYSEDYESEQKYNSQNKLSSGKKISNNDESCKNK